LLSLAFNAIGGNRSRQNVLAVSVNQIELTLGVAHQSSFELLKLLWTSKFIGVCRLIRYPGSEGCNDVGARKQSTAEHAASKKDGEQREDGEPKPTNLGPSCVGDRRAIHKTRSNQQLECGTGTFMHTGFLKWYSAGAGSAIPSIASINVLE
jgi:hypothetical protein